MSFENKNFPSQYSAGGFGIAGSTTSGAGLAFGFNATYIRIKNRGGVGTAYVDFGTTGVATTGSAFTVTSGETFYEQVPRCAGLGLATAGPSTEEGVEVVALGG
jgi:hypothetical protein